MANDVEVAFMSLLFLQTYRKFLIDRRKKRSRRWWIHPAIQNRKELGYSNSLIPILIREDSLQFTNFLRVNPENFEKLLKLVGNEIQKQDTHFRKALPATLRLQITLRCLATGERFNSLNMQFRVGRSTVGKIVKETCAALWNCLSVIYLKFPRTPDDWLHIANGFEAKWQLPHCVGAIDGKHVRMICPKKTGSLNFNYKQYFSKVLFAVAGPDYKFIYVDVGNYGSEGDSGILAKSVFGQALKYGTLNLPEPSCLTGNDNEVVVPYYFVGDQAFPLQSNLMRPFKGKLLNHPQKIFNYRLCRGRRIVENAFGILSNSFRMYHTELQAGEDTNNLMVLASLVLHNFLLTEQSQIYCPTNYVDNEGDEHEMVSGEWRENTSPQTLLPHQLIGTRNFSREAENVRQTLAMHFLSAAGSVNWQDNAIQQGYYSL